jgi:NCS1 family nucleobase:cation symporter-1
MPVVVRDLTLIAIAVGAIAANALNIYSGAMSFLAAGIKIPFALRRAIVALGFGVVGFFLAWSALPDAGHTYENFLLVIAYWIAPWLGVVLTDRYLRRGTEVASLVSEKAKYSNPAGVAAFLIGLVISIALFSNQSFYVGLVVNAAPAIGDLTAVVGLILAAGSYVLLFRALKPTLGAPTGTASTDVPIGVDAADQVA